MFLLLACAHPSPTSVFQSVDLEQGDNALLAKVVVAFDRARSLDVHCTDDAGDAHSYAAAAAEDVVVPMAGFLAETDYTCTLTEEDGETTTVRFTTPALPAELPLVALEGDSEAPESEYTVFNEMNFCDLSVRSSWLVIADRAGRIRWYLEIGGDSMDQVDRLAEITPEGDLLIGGAETSPTIMDPLTQDILYEGPPPPSSGGKYNHEVRRLDDGQVLTLASTENTDGTRTWTGFEAVVIDPVADAITWSWNSQRAVDSGWLDGPGPNGKGGDIYHANAAAILDDAAGRALWVSVRFREEYLRVDVTTGDVTSALGIDQDYALASGEWFRGQHGLEFVDDHLFLFDNQTLSQTYASRAVEYQIDVLGKTATELWSYDVDGWYPSFGDAVPLPSDRVLVTSGSSWCLGEYPPSNIREVERATGEVPWKLVFPEGIAVYRAGRIEGCALFQRDGACL